MLHGTIKPSLQLALERTGDVMSNDKAQAMPIECHHLTLWRSRGSRLLSPALQESPEGFDVASFVPPHETKPASVWLD